MKTIANKTNTNSNPHSSKPFFSKSGEGGFFSQSQEIETPFFTPLAVQPKLTIGRPDDINEQETNSKTELEVKKSNHPNPLEQTRTNSPERINESKPASKITKVSGNILQCAVTARYPTIRERLNRDMTDLIITQEEAGEVLDILIGISSGQELLDTYFRMVDDGLWGPFERQYTIHSRWERPSSDARRSFYSLMLRIQRLNPSLSPTESTGFICGPDITVPLQRTANWLRSHFPTLPEDQRDEMCEAIGIHSSNPEDSWDISGLHRNEWIHQQFRPRCATAGAGQGRACGESVQVGNQCYHSGSANYLIYGVMGRLCGWSIAETVALIELYKRFAPNFRESAQWAMAGWMGWPSGGIPPMGDRNNCRPVCDQPLTGITSFDVRWCPHLYCPDPIIR